MSVLPTSKFSGVSIPNFNKGVSSEKKSFADYLTHTAENTMNTLKYTEKQGLEGIGGQGDLITTMSSLEELGLTVKMFMQFHKQALQAWNEINRTTL
jgi:flagellar hook-basal body complex protein FliE